MPLLHEDVGGSLAKSCDLQMPERGDLDPIQKKTRGPEPRGAPKRPSRAVMVALQPRERPTRR